MNDSRLLLDGVLKNSVDGIVAYEAIRDEQGDLMDFRFLLVNPAAERLLGQPAGELVGRGLLDTFPDIVLDGLFEPFVRIVETGETLDFEYSTVRSNAMRWYRVAGVKLEDGLVMSYSDITERKQAEIELAYERDLLRTLLDNSPDRIYFKDTQCCYIKVSISMAEAFRLNSVDELLGKTDFDFFKEDFALSKYEDEQKIMSTGHPLIDKVERDMWKDGREGWVLTSKMPFRNKDGKIIGTFGISKDITSIKLTEAKLAEMHRKLLETSHQAGMAEVATSVLHNVGNVLNSVNVSSTLVADRVKKSKVANLLKVVTMLNEHSSDLGAFLTHDPRGKQIPSYLDQLSRHLIAEQTTVVNELTLLHQNIEHIKDIVVMQQSYAKVSGLVEAVKVSDLVEEAMRMNIGTMQRHHIEVIREYDEAPLIDIEKHKALQILVNLLRNAKYACEESGRTERKMTLRIARSDTDVSISVIDNGVGIPPENLTRIFSHGFTTRRDGHGFGLHSAAIAAGEMGGSLSVHSDGPGMGATFTLVLPYKPLRK